MPNLLSNVPDELSALLDGMAKDFPVLLDSNLVGIYVWGSLSYEAFDEICSDVDLVAVIRRDLDEREFSRVDQWFYETGKRNAWVKRIDMRFVIAGEFLDKNSRCCGFYSYLDKLTRHGSDGNPIIWINIGTSGITLWGQDAKTIAPQVTSECLSGALQLELEYLKEDLAANAGRRTDKAFIHNSYSILTACRILYSAWHGTLISKDQASAWALETVPPAQRNVIRRARENRLRVCGSTTPELEQDAMGFVDFVVSELRHKAGL